jgi:hypothetical protein
MNFRGIGEQAIFVPVFVIMKARMKFIFQIDVGKIKKIDTDNIRYIFVVLAGFNTVHIFPGPIEQSAAVHVVLVSPLYFNVTAGSIGHSGADVENAFFIAKTVGPQILIGDNLNGGQFAPGTGQQGLENRQKPGLISLFAKELLEEEEIKRIKAANGRSNVQFITHRLSIAQIERKENTEKRGSFRLPERKKMGGL